MQKNRVTRQVPEGGTEFSAKIGAERDNGTAEIKGETACGQRSGVPQGSRGKCQRGETRGKPVPERETEKTSKTIWIANSQSKNGGLGVLGNQQGRCFY